MFSAFFAVKSMAYAEARQQYDELRGLDQPHLCEPRRDENRQTMGPSRFFVSVTNIQQRFLTIIMLAYIDPGMGALAWQTIISAVVGLFFYLKKTRLWFVGIFQKLFR